MAAKVGPSVEVTSIIVREVQWSLLDVVIEEGEEINLGEFPTYELGHAQMGNGVSYRLNTEMVGKVQAGDIFRFKSIHQADFLMGEGHEFSDEELAAFGSVSAFFMFFPYVRQLLSECTTNAGLPALLLRPVRLTVEEQIVAPKSTTPADTGEDKEPPT